MKDKTVLAPDPTVIGEISAPPFIYLPQPGDLFARRAERLRFLAAGSALKPYLDFAAALVEAQAVVAAGFEAVADEDGAVEPAFGPQPGMPSIDRDRAVSNPKLDTVFERLFAEAEKIEKPESAAAALANVVQADAGQRRSMAAAIFSGSLPPDAIAEHIYVWAALQVYFTQAAGRLDPKTVKPVADGVCPACGSLPSASMVIDRRGAHGARFCCCSLCNTLWHYVRIKCLCCGSTKGIGYREVEEGGGFIKAETCDECQSWTKIIYEQKSPGAEPVADDVASLGIDMLMRELPYRRGGFSPLLAGL